ncbi:LacI family DNA-binding transcriptional regulator [Nonomuraea phyllanthi]|uniref:LacI family DNA-binding transcriptional regulator n=1 Tax=Nonomuraea phyllanthi TaxID=2219224 RepID=A0A5C4WA40_9ACTN|nr:LacI family DNA-binding transcriptional regulator [Nonomuraea phyllanthi]KAB8192790.1 LacI family DNA-binding transcriptional regulator [Nonomuraea phyllanthi]QFY08267.1 LacI family DNA-binding transcriptional regulator [Nonomuraea phyllanthi]
MADVAKLAGVSGQTVSRVVNGNDRVTAETRQKVESAMRQLGYRANIAARALATGRFGTIGVVMFNLSAIGNVRILESVVAGAQARGYSVSVAVVDAPTEQEVRAAVRGLTDRAVDGVIVIEARVLDTPHLRLLEEVPLVIADSRAAHGHPTFGMDEAAGARAAVDHLLGLGHATVHHVAGPAGSNPAQRRRAAWQRQLKRSGRAVPPPVTGDWSPQSGYDAALRLLAGDGVTAIFAANDQMAAGVLRAAEELGRRVPGDLSVVGFDDLDFTPFLSPPLTTVRQDLAAVGRRCLEHLLARIEAPSGSEAPEVTSRFVRPELVIRASTAPPR